MTHEQKTLIQECVKEYVTKYESQAGAAHSLNVSSATISQVLNGNWNAIAETMWRTLAKKTCVKQKEWKIAPTSVFKKASGIIKMEKENPNGIRGIIANASMGKSTVVDAFSANNGTAYYVRCHRHMRMVDLLRSILRAMGKDSSGNLAEMLASLVRYLERDNEPVMLLDEVDKLRDEVFEIFIDLENKLNMKCGIVFLGTPYLKKRIEAGVARGKRGYAEIYSRMRKMFFEINPTQKEFKEDVAVICSLNGVTDEATIAKFHNQCDNDIRVLRDLITAYKIDTAA